MVFYNCYLDNMVFNSKFLTLFLDPSANDLKVCDICFVLLNKDVYIIIFGSVGANGIKIISSYYLY